MKCLKLPPISRTTDKWWRHKKYKHIKVNKKMMKKLVDACKREEECIRHLFDYALWGVPYRRYRRGKNRCKHCGVKTK